MTTGYGNLNAKQRRKLLRDQQRQLEEGNSTNERDPVKKELAPVVNVKPEAASQDERRCLVQPAKQGSEAATGSDKVKATKETALSGNDMKLNAQQRRLLKRKGTQVSDSKVTKKQKQESEASGETGKSNGSHKSIHLTLFVGQLPFKTTKDMIRKHFAEAGEIQVRMLTDKTTKKFKGTAFIEVKNSKALGAALSRHHTLLLGRRINVELTASGGGTKSENRRSKIDLLRKKQSNMQVEKTKALIQKHIDGQEYKLQHEDVDDRMIDFLSWFDYETAKKALDEYNRCVSDRVNNRKAFFMGILKRFRQTDGIE